MTHPTPDLAVQKGVFDVLVADAGVAAAFLGKGPVKVYDYVPRGSDGRPSVPYPFIALQDAQSVGRENPDECDDEQEAFTTWEVLDDAIKRGSTGTKQICNAIRAACAKPLVFTGFSCTAGQAESIRHLPESEGIARSIVTLRYLLDPA